MIRFWIFIGMILSVMGCSSDNSAAKPKKDSDKEKIVEIEVKDNDVEKYWTQERINKAEGMKVTGPPETIKKDEQVYVSKEDSIKYWGEDEPRQLEIYLYKFAYISKSGNGEIIMVSRPGKIMESGGFFPAEECKYLMEHFKASNLEELSGKTFESTKDDGSEALRYLIFCLKVGPNYIPPSNAEICDQVCLALARMDFVFYQFCEKHEQGKVYEAFQLLLSSFERLNERVKYFSKGKVWVRQTVKEKDDEGWIKYSLDGKEIVWAKGLPPSYNYRDVWILCASDGRKYYLLVDGSMFGLSNEIPVEFK